MIYIASPYTAPDAATRAHRHKLVEEYTARLTLRGAVCFSPIVYAHHMACAHSIPFTADYWLPFNTFMLRHSTTFQVLCLAGWEFSNGVAAERELAALLRIPEELVSWPA